MPLKHHDRNSRQLEAGLMRSQADSERLMEAVVGRMLAGGGSDGEHGAE